MAELGTGKSVVVLAIVVGCFSILWPKIFYPMMQSALSLTAPKYDGEDGRRCQFMLDAEVTGYAFFANLCHEVVSRKHERHREEEEEEEELTEKALSPRLAERCRSTLRAVCRIELPLPWLATTALEDRLQLEADRKRELTRCLLELVKQKKQRRQKQRRKKADYDFFSIEGPSRHPPHLHLPPRMREAMGEARPDLPHLHQPPQQQSQRATPHLMKDGRPFPHPSARQPPKPQPKTGGAMSIVMPIYTIGIVGFFLYTLLKLVFKKRNEEPEQQPIIPNYHMDPRYQRYILDQDRPNNNNVKQTTAPVAVTPASKTFLNESKTKRFLEEFGKRKVELLDDEKDLEILQLKRKLQETEDTLQQILERVSENLNRAVATPIPTATANGTTVVGSLKTLISQMQSFGETEQGVPLEECQATATEGSKVEDIEVSSTTEKMDLLEGDINQKDLHSTNSSPDTESYELIGSHEDSGRSESEGSENATSSTLRQRYVHDPNTFSDDRDMNRNGSYKLSDILQF